MVSVLDQFKGKHAIKVKNAPVIPELKINTPNTGAAAPPLTNFMASSQTGGAAGMGMGIQPMRQMAEISQSPQEVQSGNWRSKPNAGSMAVLRGIDQMGESALNLTNTKLQAFNARQQAANQRISASNDSFMNAVDAERNRMGQSGGGGFFAGSGGGEAGGSFGAEARLSGEQQEVARSIIEIGRRRGMTDDDIKIGLMTGLAESELKNLRYGDRDSQGVFQQRPSQGWGSIAQVTDVNYSTNKFYDALSKTNRNGVSHWQAAQNVQRSFDPQGNNYRARANHAYAIFGSYRKAPATTGVSQGGPVNPQLAASINSLNNKYLDFDGAYGAQCVDLFNYYNQGFVGGGFIGGVSGAKDLWGNANMNKNYTAISAQGRPQMGDVVVWGGSMGGGYGHVAVVTGYNANGTIRVLQSNATPQGSRGNSIISDMPRNGVLGYYRPKKLMS